MKFRDEVHKYLFLAECEASAEITDDWEPSEELKDLFIKRRRDVVTRLKSFRRSQATKAQWRRNRYKIMKGIDNFHKSTDGKRFHRNMGKFLATRDFGDMSIFAKSKDDDTELSSLASLSADERATFMKALSSLKTHLYVETEYYHPITDHVDLELLIEEIIQPFDRMERSAIFGESLWFDDMELLVRMVHPKDIAFGLTNNETYKLDYVCSCIDKAKIIAYDDYNLEEDDNGFCLATLEITKRMLG